MFWLKIFQIIVAILLILAILLQNKGASLSGIFGGANNVFMAKRGLDKNLFYATIVLALIFMAISVVGFLL